MKMLRATFALTLALFATSTFAQVPQLLNYQGRVVVGTTNFDGNGLFKFALVNSNGTVTFWSNDGTSAGGSTPTASVTLPVVRGLYSVQLGDTAVAGMPTALPATVFTNVDVRLRVWFNDGVTGVQQFTPDQRISAVGYALMGANVPDGAITSNKLANGAVTAAKIADGSITSAKLALNTINSSNLADSITLGETNVNGRLDVYRTSANTPAVSIIGSSSQISTYGSDGLEQTRLWGVSYGELLLNNSQTNNATAVRLTAQGASGGQLELRNTNGSNRALLEGENTGGRLTLYTADGNTGAILYGNEGAGAGALSLRNTNGSARVRLYGQSPDSGGGEITVNDDNGSEVIELKGNSSGGQLTIKDDTGVRNTAFLGSGVGGYQYLYNGLGNISVYLDGDNGGAGNLSLRNTNNSNRAVLSGANSGGSLTLYQNDGTTGAALSSSGTLSLYNTNNGLRAQLIGNSSGGALNLYQADGAVGAVVDGDSGGAGLVSVRGTNGSTRASLDGSDGGGGAVRLYENDGTETVSLTSEGNGVLVVRQGDGSTGLGLSANNGTGGGGISVYSDTGSFAAQLTVADATRRDGYLGLATGSGATRVYARAWNGTGNGGYLGILDAAGTQVITLDSDVSGSGRIITPVLQITGGSDLSEQFDIKDDHDELKAGMIVCIDPEKPGQLLTSTTAYDRTVAGIISGGGGVKTGMLMGQVGTKADGKHPVALTGRVYCLVDASNGPIKPGDLLTTSDTPGHAMKVTDHNRAMGAIIGKAMGALESGKGMVLVLVSLQ
jgi:hypothetical protein